MTLPTPTPLQSTMGPWATAHVIPWDSEIFGFPVGTIGLPTESGPTLPPQDAVASLEAWTADTGAVLVDVAVCANQLTWHGWLEEVGFRCIDLALHVSLPSVRRRPKLLRTMEVREAREEDHAAIIKIAGSSFDFGRYHRDPRFPRKLADRRFAVWVEKHLRVPDVGTRFFVSGPEGAPWAFMFCDINNSAVAWNLGGVSRASSNGLLGPMFFAGVLEALEAQGVKSIHSKISAANTSVLNIYSALGFHTASPQFVYHWHSNDAAILIPSPHMLSNQ
jgi:hypothetical protein